MPFVLIIVGVVFLDAAVRNTVTTTPSGSPGLSTLLKGDFTGKDNFLYWMTAIFLIGAVGYIPKLETLSRAFMILILLVLFLSNGGFFSKAYGELFGSDQTVAPLASSSSSTSSVAPSTLTNAENESIPTSLIGL
jgi:hypothetical protein